MIPFTKMHGLGNDFVLVESRHLEGMDVAEAARRMCERHTGIGADGLLIVTPSKRADIGMRIINRDGTEAEMCGNGIRCLARYAYDCDLVKEECFCVETLAGILRPRLGFGRDGEVLCVEVDMGAPVLERAMIPMTGPKGRVLDEPLDTNMGAVRLSMVRMGVPHAVVFVDDIGDVGVEALGRAVETHPAFPERTNVNFVEVLGEGEIAVRTWERGAGATLACGTGVCASAVAANLLGRTEKKVRVRLELGALEITLAKDGRVLMKGPAQYVFEGEYQL
jgi:diaminopimelate epimerase